MSDRDCVRFLQETLPRLHLRWHGFRRVRRQVCKHLQRRLQQLQLPNLACYRRYLDRHPPEWDILDGCCRITISRFYRDRGIYRVLEREALPQLAAQAQGRGTPCIKVWSAGCGAGEEPYSLAILWALAPESTLRQTGEYIASVLHDGGLLVLGAHERLPHDLEGFAPWQVGLPIYRRVRSWHATAGKRIAANLPSSHSRRNYEFETHRLRKR